MLDADMVHGTGYFSYADANHFADLWNETYPVMRGILDRYIKSYRHHIENKGWEVDPSHPMAETLREMNPSEAKCRRRLRQAEVLRREIGQLDRGTYKACTFGPAGFSITSAYMMVCNVIRVSSLGTKNISLVYRLAADLAEAEERVNESRIARNAERKKENGST